LTTPQHSPPDSQPCGISRNRKQSRRTADAVLFVFAKIEKSCELSKNGVVEWRHGKHEAGHYAGTD
jgi:hypothetical protein